MSKRRAPFLFALAVVFFTAGCMVPVSPVPDTEKWNLILNPYFALGVDDEGLPLHWGRFGGSDPSKIEITTERASVGMHSLKITDDDPETSVGLRSHPVVAREGEQYTLEVDVYVEIGTAMLYLDFHDNEGRRIVASTATIGATTGWETITVTGTAPAGTDHVTVILYLNLPNVGVSYFDNVRLYLEEE